jgi:hypothetical protein
MTRPSRVLLCSIWLFLGCMPELTGLQDGDMSEGPINIGGSSESDSGAGGSAAAGKSPTSGGATSGGTANPPLTVAGNTMGGGVTQGGSASAGQESGGSAGTPPACVPSGKAETCNGVDDDCNDVIDDGCPGGISTTYVKDLELIGDSYGGSPFTEDCNAGEVLGGVSFAVGGYITQIKGVCYSLELRPNSNADQGYEVSLVKPRELPPHPATTSDPIKALTCSPGEIVVGLRLSQQRLDFNGTEGIITPRAWLTCARLVLQKVESGLKVAWEGPKEIGPVSGGLANEYTNWFVETKVTAPLVASRLRGQSGSFIDRAGFGVSELKVVYR